MERLIELPVPRSRYDLELTMYPSFILVMFVRDDCWLVKRYGYAKGVKIRQMLDRVHVVLPHGVSVDVARELTGLWYEPERLIEDVDARYRDIVEVLVDSCSAIRIAISSRDPVHIFVSTFLSRNTDYYTNVIRWVQTLCELTGDDLSCLDLDTVRKVSSSYQLTELPEALRQFLSGPLRLYLDGASHWDIRRELLKIRNVGPKVADAFLIFTGKTTELAPSDIHFRRFVSKLRLFESYVLPEKRYCVRYRCDECPRTRCLTGLAYRTFGRLSSWIQTVSYVIDRVYCSRIKCIECPLYRKICNV